jgi:hypothetical protein
MEVLFYCNPCTMKKILVALLGVVCLVQASWAQASWQWARGLQQVKIANVTADNAGNLYVVGSFSAPVSFTSPNFSGPLTLTPAGASDVFLARLDASGNLSWARQVGGSGAWADGAGIAVDGQGGVYLTGSFTGILTTNTGSGSLVGSLGYPSVLLMRCSAATGTAYWSRRVGNDSQACGGLAVAVGPGAVGFVSGFVGDNVSFGSLAVSAQRRSGFVAAYNSSGSALWATVAHTNGAATGQSGSAAQKVVVDGSGYCLVTGDYTTGLQFGGLQLSDNALFNTQAFVARLHPGTGQALWLKGATGSASGSTARGTGLAVTGSYCYVGGTFTGTVAFGGAYTMTAGYPTTGYVGRYDVATGATAWVRPLGYAATKVRVAAGSYDVLATVGVEAATDYSRLVCHAPSGVYQWELTTTGPGSSQPTDVAQYGLGVAYWTGSWQGTCGFGPTTLAAPADATYAYLARVNFTAAAARGSSQELSSSVALYPNPGTATVQLHTSSAAQGPKKVTVYSSFGRLMLQRELRATDLTLDVRGWPRGSYWVQLEGSGTTERRQLQVQ